MPCVRVENFPELRNFRPTQRFESTRHSKAARMSWVTCKRRHSLAVSSPWTETPWKKLNSGLCDSLWPARDPERMFVQKTRVQWYDLKPMLYCRENQECRLIHRIEPKCGAHRNSLARYFCFDLSDVKCLQIDLGQSVRSYRSCGSWITFAVLWFLLPIDSYDVSNFWGVLLTPFETLVTFRNALR